MPLWIQSSVVLLLVAACAAYVVWQIVRTFRLRGGGISCCPRGCSGAQPAQAKAQRFVIIPLEQLYRRRH